MKTNTILQYFQDYEREVKYQQSSIDVKGSDYSNVLEHPEKLQQDLLQRKTNKLFDKIKAKEDQIKRKDSYKKDNDIKEMIKLVISEQDNGFLNKALEFKKENVETEILMEAQKLASDNTCQICYPVLEKGKYRHPLFVFESILQHGSISVQKIHANVNALTLYIAFFTDMNKSEAEQAYAEEIQSIVQEIGKLQAPESIDEGLNSVVKVINEKFSNMFFSVTDYTKCDGWARLSNAFVTTESLNEFREPPFREEIALVQKKLEEKSSETRSPLHSYLLGENEQASFDQIKSKNYFHFGSYTDVYAINKKQWYILGGLNETQLLSVNGPPGTGKTTLLKEIIADTLVKKTQQLIRIWEDNWEFNKACNVYISPMKGKNDNSILVTSTNNKAVDNIGKELMSEVDYFSQFVKKTEDSDDAIAGLMCARLGKKDNVDQFRKNVLEPLLGGLQKEESQSYKETEKQALTKFNEMVSDLENVQSAIDAYLKITNQCLKQGFLDDNKHPVKSIGQIESKVNKLSLAIKGLEKIKEETNQGIEIFRKDQQTHLDHQHMLENDIIEFEETRKEYYKALEVCRSYSNSKWLSFLPKRRKFFAEYPSEQFILDQISKKDDHYSDKLEQTEEKKQAVMNSEHEVKLLENKLDKTNSDLNEMHNQLNKTQDDLVLLKQREQLKGQLTMLLQIDSFSETNCDAYELIHYSEEIRQKRYLLFRQALLLHEHYIWKHREAILYNLEYITKDNTWFRPFYSKDQDFSFYRSKGLRATWETFLLCFPVVTTTLHSFKNPSFHMIKSYIDLLLVDESGQVLPHYLVGPLYRVKRALIVGDVMQIAPVRPTMNNIIEQTDIPKSDWDVYDIATNSAQHYADRHSDIFERMEKQQLGIILEEHRRCEPAIASFSNHYVYNDILDIVKKDDKDKLFGSNLIGIDVRGIQTSNNINKQEAFICKQIVSKMINHYGEKVKEDIGIITPFRNQKDYLEKQIKGVDIGTVHTFQGQEKKYILFSTVVNHRLAAFVGGKPNLLNVAVTRAKEQFILLGNFEMVSQTKNYLSDFLNTIKKYGEAFSIFNTSLQRSGSGHAAEVFQLFATQDIPASSEFGKFLYDYFPKNVVIGADFHFSTLKHALGKAEKSIDIISPWLNPDLIINDRINGGINDGIKHAHEQQIDIHIIFGYKRSQATLEDIESIYEVDANKEYVERDNYVKAVSDLLDKLKDRLEYRPPLHVKLLLVDKQYLIIGSHNWLSNRVKQNAKEEISVILTDKDSIDYIVKHFRLA